MPVAVPFPFTLEAAREVCRRDPLAAWIGLRLEAVNAGQVTARLTVDPKHIAPNGFLHASVIMALADIACGAGTAAALPEGKTFATLEIKTNFMGTARQGGVICQARARHVGGHTQIWDAEMTAEQDGRTMALFRCTQMVLG